MKKILVAIAIISLFGCSEKTAEQKIHEQVNEKIHPLNGDERQRAEINAKKFFEKQWSIADNARGMLNECRPSDSNYNGLVTCTGMVPKQGGSFTEVRRYCGYTPELVGCSDEDTVK